MSFKKTWIIPPIALIVGLAAAACGAADTPRPSTVQPTETSTPLNSSAGDFQNSLGSSRDVEVDFSRYSQFIPRDAIMPVYEPQFLPGQSTGLDPQELVIGVAINGESKAYPAGTLTSQEMINDEVGGVPILVSW